MKTLETKAKLSQAKEARAILNEIYNQIHRQNIPDDMPSDEALRHIEDVIGWMNAQARISKAEEARARS